MSLSADFVSDKYAWDKAHRLRGTANTLHRMDLAHAIA